MTRLDERVEYALNETRILVLVAQVLLGFQLQSVMQPGFDRLSLPMQDLRLLSLCLMLLALALLLAPAAYHSIVEAGEDSEAMNRFTTLVAGLALIPFALSFGFDIDVAAGKVAGSQTGVVAAVAAVAVALCFWYGAEFVTRLHRHYVRGEPFMGLQHDTQRPAAGTPLGDKVSQLLTEVRVVLPGAQALLGFQFAVMFVDGFDKLPATSKSIHLMSLALVGLTAILLMTPAAYHRIVEEGEDTERFYTISNRILLIAMAVLAAGISLDLFVIARKISHSVRIADAFAAAALLLFYGLWFGFTLGVRTMRGLRRQSSAAQRTSAARPGNGPYASP